MIFLYFRFHDKNSEISINCEISKHKLYIFTMFTHGNHILNPIKKIFFSAQNSLLKFCKYCSMNLSLFIKSIFKAKYN